MATAAIDASSGPWFGRRPALARAVMITLYAAVFAARLAVHGTNDPITLLFALPIALAAFIYGLRGGAFAAIAAVALVVAWVAIDDVHLSAFGWITRAAAMIALGVLVGEAVDGLRIGAAAERRLSIAVAREREAAEIHDSIVQQLATAKWALESGDTSRTLDLLTQSIETAEDLVRKLLVGHDEPRRARPIPPDRAT